MNTHDPKGAVLVDGSPSKEAVVQVLRDAADMIASLPDQPQEKE